MTLLQDEDDYVKIPAVDSLLELNRPRLRQVWINALNSEKCYVSEIATKALAFFRFIDTSRKHTIRFTLIKMAKRWHQAVLKLIPILFCDLAQL